MPDRFTAHIDLKTVPEGSVVYGGKVWSPGEEDALWDQFVTDLENGDDMAVEGGEGVARTPRGAA